MVNSVSDYFSQLGGDDLGRLVPTGTDNCETCAPFLYLIMACLGSALSSETAVLQYTHGLPEFHKQIRQLSAAVSEAGVRVRDSGRLRSDFDDTLRIYSPEEIWLFDLAVDVIAMLGCVQGLSSSSLALYKSDVRRLDDEVHTHTWKHALKKAGAGPAQFQELRGGVPRHKPNPFR